MAINRNNFLRFTGSMDITPPIVVANDDGVTMPTGQDYVEIDPFVNDTANLGIDPLSLEVTSVSNPNAPFPRWNEATNKLRIYRPTTGSPSLMTVSYFFRDFLGNASNTAIIAVSLTTIATNYRGYAPSLVCLLSAFNQNTGYRFYNTLEKYYPSLGTAVIPQVLKPNVFGDPNYIAPVFNTTACPLPSTIPMLIHNNTTNPNTITITQITFNASGIAPTVFPVSVAPGASTTIYVPVGNYTSGVVTFSHTGTVTSIPWEYHYGVGGVGTITGSVGSGATFTITSPSVSGTAVSLSVN